jgi:lipopolysaccharide export system ATP-binding protein
MSLNHTLELDGVYLELGGRRILNDIYLRCQTGTVTGLLGRNGQGKSCMLRILFGMLRGQSQSIRIDQIPLMGDQRNPRVMRYLPQFNFIPPFLKIRSVFGHFKLAPEPFWAVFPEFETLHDTSLGRLSGGQKRIVEVYVMLKSDAQFLLLDEPFTHIAPVQMESVKAIIRGERMRKGILITDHLFRHVAEISDELWVLKDCKLLQVKDLGEVEYLGYARI